MGQVQVDSTGGVDSHPVCLQSGSIRRIDWNVPMKRGNLLMLTAKTRKNCPGHGDHVHGAKELEEGGQLELDHLGGRLGPLQQQLRICQGRLTFKWPSICSRRRGTAPPPHSSAHRRRPENLFPAKLVSRCVGQ